MLSKDVVGVFLLLALVVSGRELLMPELLIVLVLLLLLLLVGLQGSVVVFELAQLLLQLVLSLQLLHGFLGLWDRRTHIS